MSGPLGAASSLSEKYAEAAAYATRRTWLLERDAPEVDTERRAVLARQYRLYSASAVENAAHFLEAAIHEFVAQVAEDRSELLPEMSDDQRILLAEYSDAYVRSSYPDERADVVQRYNEALITAGKAPFDRDEYPVREVRCLFAFCHSLGHDSPVLQVVRKQPEPSAVEEGLIEAGFRLSAFHCDEPFPSLYLSHGCAEWAVLTALNFYTRFCARMDVPNKLIESNLLLNTRE